MKLSHIAIATTLAMTALTAQAKPIWQDFSITGLYGENYKLTPMPEQTTITAEYTAKVPYADVFAFIDRSESNDVKSTYFELSPRLSLSETFNTKLQYGIIKDVLISTTWEGGDGFNNYLYGVGVDLNIPHFQYATVNLYRANNELTKDDWLLSASYGVPFKLASEDFLFDGFLDWSSAEKDSHASELNWTNQLKWNVGKHISPDTRLYLGVEHSYWNNKYGVSGVTENNVSGLVKYHF